MRSTTTRHRFNPPNGLLAEFRASATRVDWSAAEILIDGFISRDDGPAAALVDQHSGLRFGRIATALGRVGVQRSLVEKTLAFVLRGQGSLATHRSPLDPATVLRGDLQSGGMLGAVAPQLESRKLGGGRRTPIGGRQT